MASAAFGVALAGPASACVGDMVRCDLPGGSDIRRLPVAIPALGERDINTDGAEDLAQRSARRVLEEQRTLVGRAEAIIEGCDACTPGLGSPIGPPPIGPVGEEWLRRLGL